jgi:long-chain fatty acid transport protein
MKLKKIAALFAAAGISAPVFATNGMNMAGYGPISEAMGGASMAYDNGVAALINNPATLGFMAPGTSRFDIGVGDLMPRAASEGTDSSGRNYFMPAFGYARRDGNITWGFGLMAQGGMGTDYSDSAEMGQLFSMNFGTLPPSAAPIADPGLQNKSEVGVGRVMFPIAYNATPDLVLAGSVDFVWAGMDVKWLIDGAHFGSFMAGAQPFGTVGGSMLGAFQGAMLAGQFATLNYGYFDFDTSSKFTQKATSTGWAGNLGFTYKVSPVLTVGGVYHSKTHLADMTTGSSDTTATFSVGGGTLGNQIIPVTGKATVKDFQWPETYGLGLAYQATDKWLLVGDYKHIGWANVMKNFSLSFTAAGTQANPIAQGGFAGTTMNLVYYQNWKDQEVLQLGAAYRYDDQWTWRFGTNIANNPIPDQYVSPLFPAIMKTHVMGGVGYAYTKNTSVDGSFVYAPKVTVTNKWGSALGMPSTYNQTVSLGGYGWTLMYSARF